MGEIKQRGRESALITYWADGFLDEVLRRCILLHTDPRTFLLLRSVASLNFRLRSHEPTSPMTLRPAPESDSYCWGQPGGC